MERAATMLSPSTLLVRFTLALGLVAALVASPSIAGAAETADKRAWCAADVEALPGDVCYLDGGSPSDHRTLVIFLHGVIAKNTTWQWNHQHQVMRLAKGNHVEVIFPRAPLTEGGYAWPGSLKSQESVERELVDNWMSAKRLLEQRGGRPFDEVFVMGFSSGAYFVSSLAMRGRLDVDGYAAFAGGQGMAGRANPIERFSPVFVGVCADDETSAGHSRAFAASLATMGIPRAVNEQPVGHGLSHVHFHHALSYLRHANAKARASVASL